MEKKTITINPELFKIKKTRKNKPIINPKLLKRKLLKRIKEHDKESNEKNDFKDSNEFLTNILKKDKTIKNPQPTTNYTELAPINKNVENILFKTACPNPLKLNYKIDDEIAHGCLRNGIKQCYRSYKNSPQKINHVPTPIKIEEDITKRIIESEINKAINGKTEFSTELLKRYDSDSLNILDDITIEPDSFVTLPVENKPLESLKTLSAENKPLESLKTLPVECNPLETSMEYKPLESVKNLQPEINLVDKEIPDWDIEDLEPDCSEPIQIKRTIKRKFTLGKNKNKIGILIKNKQTKKNALEYSKELKKISTEEIKKYLRDRGLIKVGSSAPPEIVRKIFENTKIAGDIINESNILNNLINENN